VVAAGLAVGMGWGAAPFPAATGASATGAAALASSSAPPPAGFGAAMVPVLFAYGGWQTAAFVSGEVRDPERNLPRGMLLGVAGVVLLYMAVNLACVRVLGAAGLAATPAPAAQVMRLAFGETGARVLALGVAASTLGFLSQSMLTAPRVYWAMAADGLFWKRVAAVHPRTHAPVVAVALQGGAATLLALTGEYGRILDTVVSADWIFYGLSAVALFVFRRRDSGAGRPDAGAPMRSGGLSAHPWATIAFLVASAWIVWQALAHDPRNGFIGLGLLLAGLPIYALWRRSRTA